MLKYMLNQSTVQAMGTIMMSLGAGGEGGRGRDHKRLYNGNAKGSLLDDFSGKWTYY